MERKSVYFVFFVLPKNKVDSMTLLVILSTLLTYPLTYKLYLLPLGGGEGGSLPIWEGRVRLLSFLNTLLNHFWEVCHFKFVDFVGYCVGSVFFCEGDAELCDMLSGIEFVVHIVDRDA